MVALSRSAFICFFLPCHENPGKKNSLKINFYTHKLFLMNFLPGFKNHVGERLRTGG